MKKIVLGTSIVAALLFSACKTSQLSSFDDDLYRDPVEEQQLARAQAEARAKAEADAREKANQEELARQEAENNNPYYKDPVNNSDDYYDYKYASRINRFGNPIPGAGYYDSRYTNYYTYNQNPMMFGSSIYSSYGWMPSSQFNNYSMGISMSFGSGYGYNGYGGYGGYGMGYPGYYDPFMSYGYGMGYGYGSPYYSFGAGYGYPGYYDPFYAYNTGYYNGFYNGYYSGWGYYNSFDANSGYANMSYGPRGSNSGGNMPRGAASGARMASGGGGSEREAYLQSVAERQRNMPRFDNPTPRVRGNATTIYNNNQGSEGYTNRPRHNAAPQMNSQPQGDPNGNARQESARPRHERGNTIDVFDQGGSGNSGMRGSSGSGGGGNSSSPRGGGGGGSHSGGGRPR